MEKSLDSQLVLCDKEAAVEYILKLFDTPLLKFSVNRTIDGPQIRITWHDLEKVHLLPLSMECTSDSLRHWLRPNDPCQSRLCTELSLKARPQ